MNPLAPMLLMSVIGNVATLFYTTRAIKTIRNLKEAVEYYAKLAEEIDQELLDLQLSRTNKEEEKEYFNYGPL